MLTRSMFTPGEIFRKMDAHGMAGEVLQHTGQFFSALIEYSSDAIMLAAPDGAITYASPVATYVTGYTPCELIGMNSFAFLHPQDQVRLKEQLTGLVEHAGERLTVEYRWYCKDGSWRWIESIISNGECHRS